jgi:hypothetical protein
MELKRLVSDALAMACADLSWHLTVLTKAVSLSCFGGGRGPLMGSYEGGGRQRAPTIRHWTSYFIIPNFIFGMVASICEQKNLHAHRCDRGLNPGSTNECQVSSHETSRSHAEVNR